MTSSTSVTRPAPLLATRRTLRSSSIRLRLGVQPTGGVGEHEVDVAGRRPLDAVEDHRAGVAALVAADELGSAALGPRVQLLGGGGAERVAGGHQHAAALVAAAAAPTLPIVVVLPTPLTPTNSHTFGDARPRRPRSAARGRRRRADRSSRPAARRAARPGSAISLALTRARRPSSSSSVTRTPTSARSSASSRSSHVSSVMPPRPRMPRNAPARALRALRHPRPEARPLDDRSGLDGDSTGPRCRTARRRRRCRRTSPGSAMTAGSVSSSSSPDGGGATRWCRHRRGRGGRVGRSAARAAIAGGRPRRRHPVDDDHADPEDEHDRDEDEIDPLHGASTLPGDPLRGSLAGHLRPAPDRRAQPLVRRTRGRSGGGGDALGDRPSTTRPAAS